MKCLPPNEELNYFLPSLGYLSHEGTIHAHPESEIMSAHLDHQIEGKVEVIEEGFLSLRNPPLTKPISPPIVEIPSTRCVDHFLITGYHLGVSTLLPLLL